MENEKKKSILDRVNQFFSSNDIDAKVIEPTEEERTSKEKFETVLLVDGVTEVTIEPAIEMGAAIVLTAEDGTPVPAPVGEYELQDGRVLVVAEDGVVAEVKDAEMPTEEPLADDTPAQADKVKRIIERIESEKIFEKLNELEETVKFLKEENETLTAKLSEVQDEFTKTQEFTKETFNEVVELVGNEPSKDPVKKPIKPVNFSKENPLEAWLKKQEQ